MIKEAMTRAAGSPLVKKAASYIKSHLERPSGTGYARHGASSTKKSTKGWITEESSPDLDISDNLSVLRARSRDLYMGTPLAAAALKTIRTNEVGAGLRLNPQIDARFLGITEDEAAEWEASVLREWKVWIKECDAARKSSFGQLQSLARMSELMSGDVFVVFKKKKRPGERYRTKIALIEGDRVVTPSEKKGLSGKIRHGIEIDDDGEPLYYYIAKKHPGRIGIYYRDDIKRVRAYGRKTGRPNVLHIMEAERPGQRRGVPVLSPVIEAIKQLGRYADAEVAAAVVDSFFAAAVTTKGPSGFAPSIPEEMMVDKEDQDSYELANGSILELREGEELSTINPTRPSSGFEPFVTSFTRYIGAALELPYEILVKHFNSSYSASRAALLEAWKRHSAKRTWFAEGFCQPIYEEWLFEAVAKEKIKAPGFFENKLVRESWCRATWHGPSRGQLNPVNEVRAAAMRVEEGFSTRAKEAAELTGSDWEENNRARMREEEKRKKGPLTEGNE